MCCLVVARPEGRAEGERGLRPPGEVASGPLTGVPAGQGLCSFYLCILLLSPHPQPQACLQLELNVGGIWETLAVPGLGVWAHGDSPLHRALSHPLLHWYCTTPFQVGLY